MHKPPTLSALVVNDNQRPYLEGCLSSLFEQSRPPHEVVVIDDASDDGSHVALHEISRWVRNFRCVRMPSRLGFAEALRRGHAEVRGDYVYVITPGDRVLPGAIENSLRALERFPEAAVCCGPTTVLNLDDATVSAGAPRIAESPCLLPAEAWREACAAAARSGHISPVAEGGTIFRRDALAGAGGFRSEPGRYAGWLAFQVMALRHGVCAIPDELAVTAAGGGIASTTGKSTWDRQTIELDDLLGLLRTDEYRDLFAAFQTGQMLSQFGPALVRVVAGQPHRWDREHALLIDSALHHSWTTLLNDPDPLVRQGTAVCLAQLGPRRINIAAAAPTPPSPVDAPQPANPVADNPPRPRSTAPWRLLRPVAARLYHAVHNRLHSHLNRPPGAPSHRAARPE
jgi:glycosyltransferase involved in cell wall biosynthesis